MHPGEARLLWKSRKGDGQSVRLHLDAKKLSTENIDLSDIEAETFALWYRLCATWGEWTHWARSC